MFSCFGVFVLFCFVFVFWPLVVVYDGRLLGSVNHVPLGCERCHIMPVTCGVGFIKNTTPSLQTGGGGGGDNEHHLALI